MVTTDRLQSVTLSTDPGREMRIGGAVLFIGALLFLAMIGFELIVGWPPSGEATSESIAVFMHQHWSSLRWIWGAQMLAGFLIASSGLLLLQSRHLADLWRPASVLWSTVAIAGIVLTVAFGLALGSYPPALGAVEGNPEIFTTVRGGVRFLGASGIAIVGLGLTVLFIREGVTSGGMVPRSWILGIALAVGLAIMSATVGLLRPPAASAVVFFVPVLLGLALWRAGRQLAPRVS